jgi:uncharacterized protein
MLVLKPDPWNPDYGAAAEAPFEDEATKVVVDTTVETADWSAPITPEPCPEEPVSFVDGVMRIDLRVLAEDGDRRAWGLLGSYAAGGVRCNSTAEFAGDPNVGRVLVLGGRLSAPPLDVRAGAVELSYETRSIAAEAPPLHRRTLQRLMLEAEQRMAMRLATEGWLVFADGPLHLNAAGELPVVGVVKRMVTAYLDGDAAALLPRLVPGQRTPIFALGNAVLDRYAWYQRLLVPNGLWHELAALVRCEVRMEMGVAGARNVADRTACTLPRFAGRPGVDPRAPQNLTPVGALEARLRHLLGHPIVIRRALQARLAGGETA